MGDSISLPFFHLLYNWSCSLAHGPLPLFSKPESLG